MEKISMNDIRKKNYSDVYRLIYQERRISKSQIAAVLQMSLPTVTQHLTVLEEDGLIEKQGQLASGIGRKAAAYAPRVSARAAAGVEVLPERVTAVVIDLYGAVIAKKERPLAFSQEDAYFRDISDLIQDVLGNAGVSNEDVLGAGLGMQGLVSENGHEMLYGKILDCTGLTVTPAADRLPYPVRFVHDAECAAELELWKHPELTDAIYLSLGEHLGGAIISNGKIQRGRTGRTGTFEHMTLEKDGRHCYCGKLGCVERYCSADALLHSGETLPDFFRLLREGTAEHCLRWAEYIDWLAIALNNLHMVLDSTIVLGGHIAPYLTQDDLDRLFAAVQTRTAFPESESFLRLGVQEDDIIATGAAIPFVRSFLDSV
ncbi:MAG: ROK family transcriptional regulator [Oscillibacter sp.]|nr:ROK family transcriptional regulator [Oscillibacter sp.]